LNRVKECRLKAHMSQYKLAKACGLARPTISKIECGETTPSALSRQKIADALGFQVHEVFPDDYEAGSGVDIVGRMVDDVLGIAVTNGIQVAAGVRGGTPRADVKGDRIEGFLIDSKGEKLSNGLVSLILDGEKVDSTVSSTEGRFVFKDVKPADYVILAGEKFITVTVDASEDEFAVDI
jgi:transcriptional regulator with XRE-family HTH domain